MNRIGIMGGTFNPPHNGHVHAARQAAQALQFDRLLLIPDNIPPHKTMPQGSANGAQRLEMTRRMAALIPGAEASDMELKRGGRSFTADTLRRLTAENPGSRLYFIMGTDMLLSLDKWREPETICALASLAVIARDDQDKAAIARKAAWLHETWQAQVEQIDCPALPVSSTALRENRSLCRDMVPPDIFAYIEQQGLYFGRLPGQA
ncbi:MAG: nicotinate (nicotinamide) nucleotide adenylyltransferase [Eubacteriales bacterium]|nr:nicotinate (nicotinamide) nucleotide adenylyltransferase [Eubacteriales bacterium]